MNTHAHRRLLVGLAIIVMLALVMVTSTTALAGPPVPRQPWMDDSTVTPTVNPNTPANLAKIVASTNPVRVVIQLDNPPVAQYRGGIKGLAPSTLNADGHLNLESAAVRAYGNYLAQAQDRFVSSLASVSPSAQVEYKYQLAFNGVSAKVPGNMLPAIKKMTGVKAVTVAIRHYPDMDSSLQLIGLYSGLETTGTDQGIWKQLGGHAKAGKGVKIADIDTGIDQTNPFFSPAGFAYPAGFPKGNKAYTTPKVIAARAYFRPEEPPDTSVDCACPQDHIGHGSHTAGTMAGRFGTSTPFGVKISGVAPQAWLMSYKIFYTNIVNGGQYSETPEELMAIEDVVRDGADVVNNSWGGTGLDYATDPDIQAYGAAVDAGVIVVFSAGNNGPSANSIGNPGNGEKFISVGASTTDRLFYHSVNVPGGDSTVTNLFGAISSGPSFSTDIGPLAYVDSLSLGNELGCSAFSAGAFSGKIAMIKRGTCTFAVKVNNAAAAGATAVVVWNNVPGLPISMGSLEGTTIPSVMVSNADGLSLRNWLTGHSGAQIKIGAAFTRTTNPAWQDQIASFSSKGPNTNLAIKPDLVAPGVNILSSYLNSFQLLQGTSMAAPHVTGVAALVHQLHPGWKPAQVKSALMTTTELPASLDASCTDALGAPYPGPMCRGAGRLSADYPGGPTDPGLVFDMPSVSLGAQYVGGSYVATINAKNVAGASTYNISVDQTVTDPNVTITPSVATLAFGAAQTKSFNITFNLGAGLAMQDYYGMIMLNSADGKHKLHIPYWFRPLAGPALPAADVLLIDDDSSNTRGLTDYRSFYTNALTSAGISYAVLETDTVSTCASPWEIAKKYSKTIMFTGDSRGYLYYCEFGIGFPNISGMNNYLAGGGRLALIGQNAANGLSVGDGRDADLKTYFGATYVQNNVFGAGLPPKPSAQGVSTYNPFLQGVKVDFSAGADGAGNQTSNDELNAMFFTDTDTLPLFQAISGSNLGTGMVGTRASSEPTLERTKGKPRTLWTTLGYRTILLSFGLEGVNDTTGYATRASLIQGLVNWLGDSVTVTLAPATQTIPGGVNKPVKLTATAASSIPSTAIVSYRWDWGDGNTPAVTSTASAYHGYAAKGTYKARVEVMDAYGHKMVSNTVTVIIK